MTQSYYYKSKASIILWHFQSIYDLQHLYKTFSTCGNRNKDVTKIKQTSDMDTAETTVCGGGLTTERRELFE